jgi:predicted acetyltransferase
MRRLVVPTVDLRDAWLAAHEAHPSCAENGHIGYGIRPSRRGRGLATWAVGEVLREAAARGFERVIVVCQASNVASARVIEHQGGQLEPTSDHSKRRYRIDLSA